MAEISFTNKILHHIQQNGVLLSVKIYFFLPLLLEKEFFSKITPPGVLDYFFYVYNSD